MQHAFSTFRESGKKRMIIWCLKDNRESRKFYENVGGKEYKPVPTIGAVRNTP